MGETLRRVERQARRAAGVLVIGGLGTLSLTGCGGDEGYGAAISECREGDNTGIEATHGSGDLESPREVLAILAYAENKPNGGKYTDDAARQNLLLDGADELDQPGEVVCTAIVDDQEVLVLTPAGFDASEDLREEIG